MQSASDEFIAAETARERHPVLRVWIDWEDDGFGAAGSIDDLTSMVEQLVVDRELRSSLPQPIKLLTGRSSARATITIGGGDASVEARTAAWYFSPDNPDSPLAGLERHHRPVKVEAGYITANGPEYLTLFTGRTRSIEIDSTSGLVTIECLDGSEDFRGGVQLPNVLADDHDENGGLKPGLNGSFLIDWGLRQQGYYASPPPRTGAKVVCTLHGSAFPERGDMANVFSALRSPLTFQDGPFVDALVMGGIDGTKIEMFTQLESGVRFNFRMGPSRIIAAEGWVKVQSGVTNRGVFGVFSGTNGVGLYINSSGVLALYQRTPNSGPHNQTTSFDIRDGQWHYVAFRATYGSNSVSTVVCVDGTTTTLGTPSGFDNTTTSPQPAMTICHIGKCYTATGELKALLGSIADVQFSEEDIAATGWLHDFTPTAELMPSLNKLIAVPPLDGQLWDALAVIAEAEFGALILDEENVPHFYTRAAWQQPPFDTVQMTLTTADAIKQLVTDEAIDTVRTWVVIGGVQPIIRSSAIIWQAGGRIWVPANNQDIGYGPGKRTFAAGYDGPIYNLDTSLVFASTVGITESAYRAAQEIDGTGGDVSNLTFEITTFANHCFITITNPNAFVVWLVNGTTVTGAPPGQPKLVLYGQQVTFDQSDSSSRVRIDKRDQAAWATYGQQLLELTDNPCRQDLDSMDAIADDLLAQTVTPTRVLRQIPIVGRLRLQLGDRVRLTDAYRTMLDEEFWVTRIQTTISKTDGVSQTIDVRTAT